MKSDPSLVSLGKSIVWISSDSNQLCLYCIINTVLITILLSSEDGTQYRYWILCSGNPFSILSEHLLCTIDTCKCNWQWQRGLQGNGGKQCETCTVLEEQFHAHPPSHYPSENSQHFWKFYSFSIRQEIVHALQWTEPEDPKLGSGHTLTHCGIWK